MQRTDSLEKTLMLKIEGKRRGRQRMRWLDGITSSMDKNLSKLQWDSGDRGAWRAAVHGVGKSWTRLSNWTITMYMGAGVQPRRSPEVPFGWEETAKKRKPVESWLSAESRLLYSFTSVLVYPKTNNPLKRFKEGGMLRLYQVHNHGLHHK